MCGDRNCARIPQSRQQRRQVPTVFPSQLSDNSVCRQRDVASTVVEETNDRCEIDAFLGYGAAAFSKPDEIHCSDRQQPACREIAAITAMRMEMTSELDVIGLIIRQNSTPQSASPHLFPNLCPRAIASKNYDEFLQLVY